VAGVSRPIEFRLLGPPEVVVEGRALTIGSLQQRAILMALLLQGNTTVSSDRLVHVVWGDDPPASAASTLRGLVWRLRRRLVGVEVTGRDDGYLLVADDDSVDARRFDRLVTQARVRQRREATMTNESGRGTYRTLDEQAGRLSEAEERFERKRRTIGLFLAPTVFLVLLALPMGLTRPQQNLAAVLGVVLVLWITEAIPIPVSGLLGVCLCVMLQVTEETDEIFASFSNSTVFLFIGSFIIAEAMLVHRLDRRLAFTVLGMRFVGSSTTRIILAFGLIGALTSPFMSNTGAAAMMLPIAIGVMTSVGGLISESTGEDVPPGRLRFGAALMLVITYSITVGGLLLPIGSPPNLIGRNLVEEATGEPITFLEWFFMALPVVVVMFVAVIVVVVVMNRPEVRHVPGVEDYVAAEKAQLGRLSRGERNTLIAFGLAVIGWSLPGIVALFTGDDSAVYADVSAVLDEGVVAVVAAGLLFVLPVNWPERRFTLSWSEASRIDWGTVLLFGSGIALGSLMSKTGLAREIGEGLSDALNVSSELGITVLVVVIAVIISETTSNTASAAIVVPIAVVLSQAVNVNPTVPGLAAVFGANYGFMLPVSTPPNAIVYSSGYLPITRMIRAGAVFDVVGAVLCVAGVAVMARLVGLTG
jgi:sodium-dependent dicarboxylate transporter 2/3/5